MLKRHLLIIFSISSLLIISCGGWQRTTPKEFLNHTIVDKTVYTKDSTSIVIKLSRYLAAHRSFFENSSYFDSTQIILDSIIYNGEQDKLVVFVIAKNPTRRQMIQDSRGDYYYDATSYLAIRKADTFLLRWTGPNFTNCIDKNAVSRYVRNACFTNFYNEDSSDLYRYNMNDTRFWNAPIWGKTDEWE